MLLIPDLGELRIFIKDKGNRETNLNPAGEGGDFIAFPVVGDAGFYQPEGQTTTTIRLDIGNFQGPANLLANITPCPSRKSKQKKPCISSVPAGNATPMLHTTFSIQEKKVTKARLYVTASGIHIKTNALPISFR